MNAQKGLIRHGAKLGWLMLCVGLLAAQVIAQDARAVTADRSAATTANHQPSADASQLDEYVVAVDDVLDIYVVDISELTRSYRVGPQGTITLPLLARPVAAAGLTLPQLSEAIRAALHESGVVMRAQVTVSVQQSRLHSVSVTGAVKHPQVYTLLGHTTILDVISQAEGLADDAGNIAIVRRGDIAVRSLQLDPADEAALTETVDLKNIFETRDTKGNITVYPGDHVTVPRAGVVYVVGAVNKPGGYPMHSTREGMTVLQAVALSGDLKPTARPDQAMIVRRDSNASEGRIQIPVDLKKVLLGKKPDTVLKSEDILFVPDSATKRAMRTAVQLAASAALFGRF